MTTPTTVPVDALTELIAERHRFEGWIRALEDRADSVPEHILMRVREDYSSRLRDVIARLGEHAAELAGAITGLEERLAGTQAAISEREETRLEGELRAAVGEYEAGRWENLRSGLDTELATLGSEREALERELGELRSIYEQAVPTPPPAEVPPARAPAQPAAQVRQSGSGRKAAQTTAAAAHEEAVASSARESAAMLDDLRATGEREGSGGAQPVDTNDRQPAESGPMGDLGIFAASSNSKASSNPNAAGNVSPGSAEAAPASDGAKTLRCQECSALNYPTEWYCERCGGELATL